MSADRLERFLGFSTEATGYSAYDLLGTGEAQAYLEAADTAVGADLVDRLLDRFEQAAATAARDGVPLAGVLRRELLSDARLGPLARNIAKMWYSGIWFALPRRWVDAYGAGERNVTLTVDANAYVEGLVWPTIGANPPGAKAPGFGSWALPPRIPAVDAS
jgi:hypothetical protein